MTRFRQGWKRPLPSIQSKEARMARHGDSSFCCLDARINEEHRALFKLLDQIATHRRKTDREDLELLLKRLLEHTLHHFAHEESLMRTSRYANSLAHLRQHRSISNIIRDALGQVARGLMISPVEIARIKETYTFHFKRDDLPFMTAPQTNSVREFRTGRTTAAALESAGAPVDHLHAT
jgi:hemerythrin-like metal-binding protein